MTSVETIPPLSVLMPVYNAARYVAEATESILNQTFRDFEFVIIDDGSTDGSLDILRRYEQQDARIRLYSRENRGLVATLNEGIGYCRAPLIARMDADDISLPERFDKQVAFMAAHPEVVLCGTAILCIDEKNRHLRALAPPTTHEDIEAAHLEGSTCICHPSALLRRETVIDLGGYDENAHLIEDYDLWLRLGEVGVLANLPEMLLRYREHASSVSTASHMAQVAARQRVLNAAMVRRGLQPGVECRPWRPITRADRHARLLQYGWMGFMRGDRSMARDYGWRAVKSRPCSSDAWRLLACALLKPLPKSGNG